MKYEIFPLDLNYEIEWDRFVGNHKKSTIFHTIMWKKVMEETFDYRPEYYVAKNQEGKIVGISPAFFVNKIFGSAVVSQPFFEYGGILIENGFEDVYEDILNFYINKINNEKIKYMEIKLLPNENDKSYAINGFGKQFKAFGFYIDIKDKNYQNDIWSGLYDNKVRNSIRKGIKSGVKITQEKNIDLYYNLYLKTMTKLGSPPYPRILFENVNKFLGDKARFTFAYIGNRAIAAMFSLLHNGRILIIGNVSDPDHKNTNANDVLYNEQIENGIKNRFDIIDFGRTRPNSSYESFKKKWGGIRTDLYSYIYPSSQNVNVDPYKYYLIFSNLTKKVPWILTRTGIGPFIIKRFP